MFSQNGLPIEVLLEIFSNLTPETTGILSGVNKWSNTNLNDPAKINAFWRQKFQLHFPHRMKNKPEEIKNWFVEFRDTYNEEYQGLPLKVRKLFSLIKESDVEGLKSKLLITDLDCKDKHDTSLLTYAWKINHQPVLDFIYKIIIKSDSPVGIILYWSIICNQNESNILSLIDQNPNSLDITYSQTKFRIIHIAAKTGRVNIIKALIEKTPALLEQTNNLGETPLIFAIIEGHVDVVDYLINQGANLNAATHTSYGKKTAFLWAVELGHTKIIDIFINKDPSVITTILWGKQPIHFAAEAGQLASVKKLLEHNPALLEQTDSFNQTPLIWAAAEGHADVVQYLIKRGANVEATTVNPGSLDDGKTSLFWALEREHATVVKLLFQNSTSNQIELSPERKQLVEELSKQIVEISNSYLFYRPKAKAQKLSVLLMAKKYLHYEIDKATFEDFLQSKSYYAYAIGKSETKNLIAKVLQFQNENTNTLGNNHTENVSKKRNSA